MKLEHLAASLGLSLGVILGLPACGPGKPAVKTAKVQVGTMPANGTFRGVWFNEAFGELHLAVDGSTVVGGWKNKKHGKVGKLTGTITGDVLRYSWQETKMGAIGPGAKSSGKGYFKFQPVSEGKPVGANDSCWVVTTDGGTQLPKILGEWGLGESEAGGGDWEAHCVQRRDPDMKEVKGEDDPTVDSSWDKEAPKK